MPIKTQLNIYVEVDVLTAGTTAKVVNAILESLLYQRNQIPFVYKTYGYYVNKWLEQEQSTTDTLNRDSGVQSFQVQRKKQQATNTKKAISAMREVIKNTFEKRRIKSLRFLFGATTFTPKEAYTIHIPTDHISINHLHDHHQIPQAKLNSTLLSLLTSESLYDIFSHNLNPTNTYLEFEIFENDNLLLTPKKSVKNYQIFPKDFSPLPGSCKDIHLYLIHKHSPTVDYKRLKCCKELQVFEDISYLNLRCDSDNKEEKSVDDNKLKTFDNTISGWWEAETVVRGFKDQPIKGCNIWC